MVATGCTLSGTICTTGSINSNTTVSFSATLIPIPTYSVTLVLGAGTTGVLSVTSVQDGNSVTLTGVGLLPNYQNLVAVGCVVSGTTCQTAAIHSNLTINLSATLIPPTTPGIDNVKKSLRAVYDADLLATPICFQVQTHGTGFHVTITRFDDNSNGETVTLNDAGNDCDVAKNDNVFSGKLTMTSVPSLPAYGGKIGRLLFMVALVSDTDGTNLVLAGTELRVVSATLKGTVKTTQSGAFTIASNALFYDVPNDTSQADVAKAIYGIVNDNYDGLMISGSRSNSANDAGAQDYQFVRQPVVYGTGITSFGDSSLAYGSNGVLLGIIENNDQDAWDQAFNHEVGIHMLGCCYASNPTLPLSNAGLHLSGLFDFSDGQMGGAATYMVKQSNGDYVVTINTKTAGELSALTKYFDRVIPAGKMPPMCAAFGAKMAMPGTVIPASQVTCFTVQDIIAQFGPVSPARTTFTFNVLSIYRYEDGQMNDALLTSSNFMSIFYAGNTACGYDTEVPPLPCSFNGAMGGDASLSTTVSLK